MLAIKNGPVPYKIIRPVKFTTLHFLYDGEKEIGAMSDGRIVQLRTLNSYFSSETGATHRNGRMKQDSFTMAIAIIALSSVAGSHPIWPVIRIMKSMFLFFI